MKDKKMIIRKIVFSFVFGVMIMKKLILAIMSVIVGILVVMLLILCIMTPEKTKDGNYTNPILYWTSDTYMNNNF